MRSFRYVLADVFTDTPLAGNQLAVFTDARDLDELTMQALALELGLSETVFVLAAARGRDGAHPDLHAAGTSSCSPATRASEPRSCSGAPLQLGTIALETGNGIVPVELERDQSGRIVFGRMTQPHPHRSRRTSGLTRWSRRSASQSSQLPVEVYDNGIRHAYVVLPSKEDVAVLRPDMNGLSGLRPRRRDRARRRGRQLEDADVLAARRRR